MYACGDVNRDAEGFASKATSIIEERLTPPGDKSKAGVLEGKAKLVAQLYASGAETLDNAKSLFVMKQYVQARSECETSIQAYDKAVLEGGKDLGQPSRDLLQRIRAEIAKIEEQNAKAAEEARKAAAQKVAAEKAKRSVLNRFVFEIAADGMAILPDSDKLGLRRLDRSLPLDFRPAFLQPQIPATGYSYVEVELEEAGLAAMLGVTRAREVDDGSRACAERWTVSMLDGSIWHNDVELTARDATGAGGSSAYKGFSVRETVGSVLRSLDVLRKHSNRRLGFSKGSGGSNGDRIGLLVNRSQRTMHVFINGVRHPRVVKSLPETGPLFFMAELLSDHQQIRIVPDAVPSSLDETRI